MTTGELQETLVDDIDQMEMYRFLALVGKKVIHPGGRPSTEIVYRLANISSGNHVLEVGCGVGTTAIDIDDFMVESARARVAQAGLSDVITVQRGDILNIPFTDGTFDRVIIETVTMFVDQKTAARECLRVCERGGVVVDHEFVWTRTPPDEIRNIIEVQLCPSQVNSPDGWSALYRDLGVQDVEMTTGIPSILTPMGIVRDEGIFNTIAILGRLLFHPPYLRKARVLMSRMRRVLPYLGWVVVGGTKAR